MNIDHIKTVAVVGSGTMGQGIAQVCAMAGFRSLLFDSQPGVAERAIGTISGNLASLQEKGKITGRQRDAAMASLEAVSVVTEIKADLVIEAVVEKLEVKQEIFSALEKINPARCLFTTNTSSIPVTQIATVLSDPGRLAGFHFFNPAPVMKLVEIVRGTATRPETIHALYAFAKKLNKEAVLTQDSPGFIVNRVARHFYVESLKILEENVATHEGIDKLMRSAGFRMGPFELMDLIGVDVNFSVTSSVYHAFHQAPRFRPSRLQQQKVDAGHHGRKSGKGFYDYT